MDAVAVPSKSGQNISLCVWRGEVQAIVVPSKSGQNMKIQFLDANPRWSPSPQSRVKTCGRHTTSSRYHPRRPLKVGSKPFEKAVTKLEGQGSPSPQSRVKTSTHPSAADAGRSGRRPLKVGSKPGWRPQLGRMVCCSPSPQSRVKTRYTRGNTTHNLPSPSPQSRVKTGHGGAQALISTSSPSPQSRVKTV